MQKKAVGDILKNMVSSACHMSFEHHANRGTSLLISVSVWYTNIFGGGSDGVNDCLFSISGYVSHFAVLLLSLFMYPIVFL